MPHDLLDDLDVRLVFTHSGAEGVAKVVDAEMGERLTLAFFEVGITDDPVDRSVDSMRIQDLAVPIGEDEAAAAVNRGSTGIAGERLQDRFDLREHRDDSLAAFCLGRGDLIRHLPVIHLPVDEIVVDADQTVIEITVLPAQAQDLADSTAGAEKHGEQGQPVAVHLRPGDIADESSLLCFGQSVPFRFFPVVTLLDLLQNAFRRIGTDVAVSDCGGEYGMKNRLDVFDTVGFEAVHPDQRYVELLDIAELDRSYFHMPDGILDELPPEILVAVQGGVLQFVLHRDILVVEAVERRAACPVAVDAILDVLGYLCNRFTKRFAGPFAVRESVGFHEPPTVKTPADASYIGVAVHIHAVGSLKLAIA